MNTRKGKKAGENDAEDEPGKLWDANRIIIIINLPQNISLFIAWFVLQKI